MSCAGLAARAAGVLLHVTSLPGPYGNGDLGPAARAFVDFLARAGQRYWQMLPVHPVGPGFSPYSGLSAFAGNPWLISLEDLLEQGLVRASELSELPAVARVDYAAARALRERALRLAFERYRGEPRAYAHELAELRARAHAWLEPYTLFCAARAHHDGAPWTAWERGLARCEPESCERARVALAESIAYFEFEQLLFARQWRRLREHAAQNGVQLIGDAPIFVAHDSADVWSRQAIFQLDARGEPTHVSGVPPDYFSETGQRWGTPLYRWDVLKADGYRFWRERLAALCQHFDLVRLDHFIGFARYWEIPAEAESAVHGSWREGPGADLFDALARELGRADFVAGQSVPGLPLIAEDLGSVSPEVLALRDRFGLPGMRVLQFAFSGEDRVHNDHLPHNYPTCCVAYTGTHDSDTVVGWFDDQGGGHSVRSAADCERERAVARDYLQGPGSGPLAQPIHLQMIRALFASPARLAVVPLQDWLGLGSAARMNVPGRAEGNWGYRARAGALNDALAELMLAYTRSYGRAG